MNDSTFPRRYQGAVEEQIRQWNYLRDKLVENPDLTHERTNEYG